MPPIQTCALPRQAMARRRRPAHMTGGLDSLIDEAASLQHERSRLEREIAVWEAKLSERRHRLWQVLLRLDQVQAEYAENDAAHRAQINIGIDRPPTSRRHVIIEY